MKLRPYQQLSAEHLYANPRAALWADMGMGKTLSTLAALEELNTIEDVYPALVLAPKLVCETVWPVEAQKWFPGLHAVDGTGKPAARLRALQNKPDILAINMDNIEWLINTHDGCWPYKTIIVDEATRLKGFRTYQGTVRSKKLAKIAPRAARFIELTGTPAPNGLKDLWGQAWFLDYGERLGKSYTAYMQRWFMSDYMGYNWTPRDHAFDEITERMKDVCLTLRGEDWFDIEKPVIVERRVPLPAAARKAYQDMEKTLFTELESVGVEAFNAASMTAKCHQIANGALYHDDKGNWTPVHDAKLDALDSIVQEHLGEPLFVVYNFVSDKERILKAFPKAVCIEEKGAIERWNKGEIDMLLAHPQSAGHGLNLQYGGHRIVFFSMTWNLEHYMQAVERLGPVRQKQAGFNRPVYVYHILADDTIDDAILSRLDGKQTLQQALTNMMRKR